MCCSAYLGWVTTALRRPTELTFFLAKMFISFKGRIDFSSPTTGCMRSLYYNPVLPAQLGRLAQRAELFAFAMGDADRSYELWYFRNGVQVRRLIVEACYAVVHSTVDIPTFAGLLGVVGWRSRSNCSKRSDKTKCNVCEDKLNKNAQGRILS